MSDDAGLAALAALFQEASILNREALAALRRREAPQALENLFKRKARIAENLGLLQQKLPPLSPGRDADAAIALALQAQKEAAQLEAQLAEALGNFVPRSGKVASAYGNSSALREGNKLNQSI